MAWKIISLSNPCFLSVEKNQLCYKSEDKTCLFSFEDIAVIMIETPRATITSPVLTKCAEFNVAVIDCNEKHLPIGIYTPFNTHSKASEIARVQINTSIPLQKRLWQQIVVSKINNQAEVLQRARKFTPADKLQKMALTVQSGDTNNVEATAAVLYFKSLFGEDFIRREFDGINASLNYGYAIFRSTIIRSMMGKGLIPCIGINHHSVLNNFNLADDLIEPFRPMVDLYVFEMGIKKEDDLTTDTKRNLIALLTHRCSWQKSSWTILNTIDNVIDTFIASIKENNPKLLILPELSKEPLFDKL